MNEVKRLQELAGIITEIKVNNPNNMLKYAWIDSHEDYHQVNLASQQSYNAHIKSQAEENDTTPEDVMEWEWASYVVEIPNQKIVFMDWNDEGVSTFGYDDFHEFLKEISTGYWGEDQLIEKLDENEGNGEEIFNDFYENDNKNLDIKIWEILKTWINNSEADGDSSSASLLIKDGKIIAGNPDNYYIIQY